MIYFYVGFISLISATVALADNHEIKSHFSISGNLSISSIIDGDSLRSGKLRIRLFGVDAPEKKQKCKDKKGKHWNCGIKAEKTLTELVKSEPKIFCELKAVDRFGRLVMRCFAGRIDIASALVRAGLALAYRQYSSAYVQDEDIARNNKVGMWRGSFVKPWEWRRAQ